MLHFYDVKMIKACIRSAHKSLLESIPTVNVILTLFRVEALELLNSF